VDPKLILAIFVGKLTSALIKLKGGGATAAPGLYALKIDPDLVKKLSKIYNLESILVSGTNGKTTTSRLISDILNSHYQVIHNRQGSNLLRGIASTLISGFSNGRRSDIAIWEIDEATLPEAIEHTNPKTIILLNLFRDQLDRYGEIDSTRKKWQEAISKLPKTTTLILNADDPQMSYLAKFTKGKVIYFGVEEKVINLPQVENVADIKYCLNCGSKLDYDILYSSHLGHYTCPKCEIKRPKPTVFANNLKFNPDFTTILTLTMNNELLTINSSLPGFFNVYNILASATLGQLYGVKNPAIKNKIETFQSAFGRYQTLSINGKNVATFLIKNPAGANEVLRLIAQRNNLNILAVLNDNIADGRDVSWIWDTNWEILSDRTKNVSTSGTRAWDMALRLKYAGFKVDKTNVHEHINTSINATINSLSKNDTLIILPTYTSLLSVQKTLNELGGQTKWHKQ